MGKLAMEVGIQPLFIDGCHTQLWEMAGYVRLAKQLGYDIVFTDPAEICTDWENVDLLQERNNAEGRPASKKHSVETLQACLYHFNTLAETGDEAENLVLSSCPGAHRPGHVPPANALITPAKRAAPAAIDSDVLQKIAKSTAVAEAPTMLAAPPAKVSESAESRVASGLLKSLWKRST